jgi:transcription initiation factor TFIIH subunit 3
VVLESICIVLSSGVLVDACLLGRGDSGLLRQGCDITGGIYFKLPPTGLLQHLFWLFLPGVKDRKKLALPDRPPVDYRASCFCHHNLVDVGFVCSVCLSVFCKFSPICSTCQ